MGWIKGFSGAGLGVIARGLKGGGRSGVGSFEHQFDGPIEGSLLT